VALDTLGGSFEMTNQQGRGVFSKKTTANLDVPGEDKRKSCNRGGDFRGAISADFQKMKIWCGVSVNFFQKNCLSGLRAIVTG